MGERRLSSAESGSSLLRRLLPHGKVLVADELALLVNAKSEEAGPGCLEVFARVEGRPLVEGRGAVVGGEKAAPLEHLELRRGQAGTGESCVRTEGRCHEEAPWFQDPADLRDPREL